jgi:hypothetical protein
MPFVRSLPGQSQFGPREQLNQNTAYIDGSQIYGQNMCDARKLRTFNGGQLGASDHPTDDKPLMPQSPGGCGGPATACFMAGDLRRNEHPGLGSMHTMFLREHNRIARALSFANPQWRDELLYQNTRKIIGAQLQHISFNEFLPRVLGWETVRSFDSELLSTDFYQGYDPNCNAEALNEFAGAAYRFGHSLIRPHLFKMDQSYNTIDPPVLLRNSFNNLNILLQVV